MIRSMTGAALTVVLALGIGWAQSTPAKVILLVGPPGSGKTTQSKVLCKKYGIPALSMADILKKEMSDELKKGPIAKALGSAAASGEVLPDGPAAEMLRHYLLRTDVSKGLILDGFPSTAGQAKELDAMLQDKALPKAVVVFLEVPDDVLRKRMLARHRKDDKPEVIERRIREFRTQAALLEGWAGKTQIIRVDASASVGNVSKQIVAGLEDLWSKQGRR